MIALVKGKITQRKIYLDHAAATPLLDKVFLEMKKYWSLDFGNPGSIHSFGIMADRALNQARRDVAMSLGAKSDEIIFTSGGTESDNLAILGVANFFKRVGRGKKLHAITTVIEHHAVIKPFNFLELNGFEVTYLPVSTKGIINLEDLKNSLRENTVLVSIMYANNEIGTIQPIREIGNFLKRERKDRPYPIFHTDACQAPGALSLQVSNLHVDMMSLSGAKVYGPKGIGALYVKKGTPIDPILFGGGQEWGIRSGTQNIPACVGLGRAISIADSRRKEDSERISKLRNYFWIEIKKVIKDVELNGDDESRLPNNLNIYIPQISGERLVIELDVKGIMASTGSACSSREEAPSHVLTALHGSEERAECSIRFTLGRETTKKEIDRTIKVLKEIVMRLKQT